MPDNQVTIDPGFRPSPPNMGQGRWLRFAAVAVAAFMLGWLLRSPSGELEATEASTSTTVPTRDTTSTTRPPTPTTSTTALEMTGLAAPLGEEVPGFADTITMAVSIGLWGEQGVDIVRWRSSQAAPETIVSFGHSPDNPAWFGGLDAAGIWYALHDGYGVLSVRPVSAVAHDAGGWAPIGEAVGLRVRDLAWHNTESGRLAWLSCPRLPDGPGALYTIDIPDRSAAPVPVASVPNACDEASETWINQWGDWGFALGRAAVQAGESDLEEDRTWTVLLNPVGAELAQLDHGPDGADMVAAGPEGTIWIEEPIEGSPSSFLLSLDDQRRRAVPGLTEGEWVADASWSPDGTRVALIHFSTQVDHPSIRIVDAATGDTLAEIGEPGSVVWQVRWSSDGRFLLYGHDHDDDGPAQAALVVYDTSAAAIAAEVPFPDRPGFWEIRTAEPTPTQLTPVEWGIALDDSGVHTVFTIADARPLTPDQVEYVSGRLIWDETVVDLCNTAVREVGDGFVHIGDIFQTTEGCGSNPTAMQDAFDEFGLPEMACVAVGLDGLDHEYCAPLS